MRKISIFNEVAIDIAAIELPEGLHVHNSVEIEQVPIDAIEIAIEELVRKKSAVADEVDTEIGQSSRGDELAMLI